MQDQEFYRAMWCPEVADALQRETRLVAVASRDASQAARALGRLRDSFRFSRGELSRFDEYEVCIRLNKLEIETIRVDTKSYCDHIANRLVENLLHSSHR